MNDYYDPLILTGILPKDDTSGFLLFIMYCKSINIYIPKDILKLLWNNIKIIKFDGRAEFGSGSILNRTNFFGDFITLTPITSEKSVISFNEMSIIIKTKIFLYAGAIHFAQVKIEEGLFLVESWSLTKNAIEHFKYLNTINTALNDVISGKLIAYDNGCIKIDNGFILLAKTDNNTIAVNNCIKMKFVKLLTDYFTC